MRFLIPVLATATLAAQAQSAILPQTPRSLAEAERAFALMAREKGVNAAFSAFFAADGLVFKPRPTLAHPLYDQQPDDGSRLLWEPSYAEVAASGDLGWTTGPWTWRKHASNDAPLAFGHFVSIWRKQADGTWKVALDLGISHAAAPPTPFVEAPFSPGPPLTAPTLAQERMEFLEVEARCNALALAKGKAAALEAFGADDLRTYRAGLLPARSKKAGLALVTFDEASTSSYIDGSALSAAGDLAYTYGLASSKHAPAKEAQAFSFVHLWRKAGGVWRLALDIQIPA